MGLRGITSTMSTPPAESVEGLVRALGDPGRYQLLVMVLLCFNYVPVSVNHLLMAFHGFTPEHNCRVSICSDPNTTAA